MTDTPRTLYVFPSQNAKTGRTASTYRTRYTCPTGCPLRPVTPDEAARIGTDARPGACYAHVRPGRPSSFDTAERGGTDHETLYRWALPPEDGGLPYGTVFRSQVSGDLFTDETGTPDRAYIDAVNHLVRMRPDITVIAYTHGWRTLPRDIFEGWAPRASCDSVAETAEAIRAGWSPVLVVPEDDPAGVIGSTVEGRRAVPCVYDTHGRQCVDCRLCSRQGGAVVVFRAHGSQRRHVKA